MGGDETDEYCLYPKLSSHFLLLWIQAGKKKKRLHTHPKTNDLFCTFGGYSHHIIYN